MPITAIDGRRVIEHGSFVIPDGSTEARLDLAPLFLRIRIDPNREAGDTVAEGTPDGPVLYIGKLTLTQLAAWSGRLEAEGHAFIISISVRAIVTDEVAIHTVDYTVTAP